MVNQRRIRFRGAFLFFLLWLSGCSADNAPRRARTADGSSEPVGTVFSVGGMLSGLMAGTSITLWNNGGDDLELEENGTFIFYRRASDGERYEVTVHSQPAGQFCTVLRGKGEISGADITNVEVRCTAEGAMHSVGGTLSGLAVGASVTLQNNRGDDLELRQNGSFTFPTKLADEASYQVSLRAQPMGQRCEVTNASGMISGRDVTDVSVVCSYTNIDSFTVGVTVYGLKGVGLVLRNNGVDDLRISGNGVFTFDTALKSGSAYDVTVAIQPTAPDQICTVKRGSGIINAAATSDVEVTCADPVANNVRLSASARYVSPGEEVRLDWETKQVTSCEINPGAIRAEPANAGRTTVTVHATTIFVLICQGPKERVSSSPVIVYVADSDWEQVSAGGSHNCAIKKDGRLFCWGRGDLGQLGDGTDSDSLVPVQESTAATDWTQVSAGHLHTCAMKSDGGLFCWGGGSRGELGDGTDSGSLVPVQEATFATDWIWVTAGRTHTCAVKSSGRLFCWGEGRNGALGNDSDSNSLVPVQESTAATDWIMVSAGNDHTCAVKSNGRLFCWGDGRNGVHSDDSDSDSLVPVQERTAASDWEKVSVGVYHTCAIKTDGRLFCWGYNHSGELGDNSTLDSPVPVQESTASTDWDEVSVRRNTYAVKKDGRLFCWGFHTSHTLGTYSSSDSPVPIQESTGASDWSQISVGDWHSCAVKTGGQIFCWGSGESGELGNNATTGSLVPVQEYTAAYDWIQVSVGGLHTCALKNNGKIFCWGEDDGSGSVEPNNSVPTLVNTAAYDWVQVSAGSYYTCALNGDGKIFCWGDNSGGVFGNNTTTSSLVPVQGALAATEWAEVETSGGFVTCAIDTDGRLFCWGNSSDIVLEGTDSVSSILLPVEEATSATNWVHVSIGVSLGRIHVCGLKADGALFCWGTNTLGELGNDSRSLSRVPVQEGTLATDWAQVSAGGDDTYAVKTDGRLFCWGNNLYGEFGNGSLEDSSVPVQISTEGEDWVEVSASGAHTCALKTDGRLFCWGNNHYGELGNGSLESSSVPVQESTEGEDWVEVSARSGHTCALKTDGRLFCWGDNSYGQLGKPSFGPIWTTGVELEHQPLRVR